MNLTAPAKTQRSRQIRSASPGALGPACRLRRRYAHAPAGALLTGLGAGERPSLRSGWYALLFDG
jgi:hypothetical protein